MNHAGSRLRMVREDWAGLPETSLRDGYALRFYEPGDEESWLGIHRRADLFNTFPGDRFAAEFGSDAAVLRKRQLYLISPAGEAVGTATAWWDENFREGGWGLVHWVAIVPEEQGRGLAKPLLCAVCHRLQKLGHRGAGLRTASRRLPALRLYWKFGFRPAPVSRQEELEWERLRPELEAGPERAGAE
jgi:GNAT superfamily N-acetyltransferase